MNCAELQDGTQIASLVPDSSGSDGKQTLPVKTTGDLLTILQANPTRKFKFLRTVCGHLGRYLELPGDQIPFDLIEDKKCGFRPFLDSRRYTESSIRTYVNHQRSLLKTAKLHGWDPDGNPTDAWKPLLKLAVEQRITDVVRHFARSMKSPKEVTKEAVDQWGEARIREGGMYTTVAHKKNEFWRLLQTTGWITTTPIHMLKFTPYGIPLEDMPTKLREDIETVLKWKMAPFARNRPKFGKIRPVTARNDRLILTQLASYVVKVAGGSPQSLPDLVQQDNVEGFTEWAINERHIKGRSVQGRLAGILAIVKHHPMFAGQDFAWFKTLLDSIPLEDESERKKRKAVKYVSYDELETIPAKIRAFREAYEKKRNSTTAKVAQLVAEELIFRWFLVFPWRQRNLRECLIGGTAPNLFKARIPPISSLDKPSWIVEVEAENPATEFWQISFSPSGTKTHIPVDPFMPCYETQLLGYAHLLEANGVGKVSEAALIYFDNCCADYYDEPLCLLTDDGMNIPFTVKIHKVAIERKSLDPYLKSFRAYADMLLPPDGRDGCKDCERLEQLFGLLKVASNAAKTTQSTLMNRDYILKSMAESHAGSLIAESRRLEEAIGEEELAILDSAPGPMDL